MKKGRSWKRLLAFAAACLSLGLCFAATPKQAFAGTPTQPDVYVDGELMHFDVQPQVVNYRTLVPLRMIFEALGASVSWDGPSSLVTAVKDGTTIHLTLNSNKATVNGKTVLLDVPARLVHDRTMVPVRFIAESFGDKVGWNEQLGQVLITSVNAPSVRVVGADSSVQNGQTAAIQKLLQSQNLLGKDEQSNGLYAQKPIWVYVTNSDAGYLQAVQTYVGRESADLIAQDSDGVASESHIVLPLEKNQTTGAQMNTLAHELFHTLVYQSGAESLPSWVNEGVAWQMGMNAEFGSGASVMRASKEGDIRDEILQAVANKSYVPLVDDAEQELTALDKASYDLEWQDYMAVQFLVKQYGQDKLKTYLQKLPVEGSGAFADVFGISEKAFGQQFLADLDKQIATADQGVQITLQVPSNYQGDFSIMPLGGSDWQDFNLTPGMHTIQIYKSGKITGTGITQTEHDSGNPDSQTVYLVLSPNQPKMEQGIQSDQGGLAINESYGQYYLYDAYLFKSNGQAIFPSTDTLFGVKLLDVQPILVS